MNRWQSAWYIQQGACNPSGVARALVQSIDEAQAELQSTDAIRKDIACRMICHQLAFLLGVAEYDNTVDAYSRDFRIVEERGKP